MQVSFFTFFFNKLIILILSSLKYSISGVLMDLANLSLKLIILLKLVLNNVTIQIISIDKIVERFR